MLCCQTFRCAVLRSFSRLGHLLCVTVLCLLIEVFFCMPCLPLALWLWHWSTVVWKTQYITAAGFPWLPALLLSLHSREVSEFPWRWRMSDICSAWATSEGLQPWFVISVSKSGCGTREPPVRAITTTSKTGPFAPPRSHFGEEWLLWCFKIGSFLQKQTRN